MYASIKAVAVRVCLCKDCSFYMYASMMVTVVRICSYKAGILLCQMSYWGYAGVKDVAFTCMLL